MAAAFKASQKEQPFTGAENVDRSARGTIAEQVAGLLRFRLQLGMYVNGGRLPGEVELAEEFKVNRGTVRKALALLAEEGLIARRQGKGTFVRPGERRRVDAGPRDIRFVVWDDWTDYYHAVVLGASHAAQARGYVVSGVSTGMGGIHESEVLQRLLAKPPAGVLLTTAPACSTDFASLVQAGVPVVQVDEIKDRGVDYVVTDNFGGVELAVEHLYGLGHRSIAHLTTTVAAEASGRERLFGFRDTCQQLGLAEADCPVASFDTHLETAEQAFEGVVEYVGRPESARHTAYVCYNDYIATIVIRAAHALGKRVPEDLSVVGFDDSLLARNGVVPLSSVGWDLAWMGRFAVELLMERIERPGDAPARGIVMPARLAVRRSTGAPRNGESR